MPYDAKASEKINTVSLMQLFNFKGTFPVPNNLYINFTFLFVELFVYSILNL